MYRVSKRLIVVYSYLPRPHIAERLRNLVRGLRCRQIGCFYQFYNGGVSARWASSVGDPVDQNGLCAAQVIQTQTEWERKTLVRDAIFLAVLIHFPAPLVYLVPPVLDNLNLACFTQWSKNSHVVRTPYDHPCPSVFHVSDVSVCSKVECRILAIQVDSAISVIRAIRNGLRGVVRNPGHQWECICHWSSDRWTMRRWEIAGFTDYLKEQIIPFHLKFGQGSAEQMFLWDDYHPDPRSLILKPLPIVF